MQFYRCDALEIIENQCFINAILSFRRNLITKDSYGMTKFMKSFSRIPRQTLPILQTYLFSSRVEIYVVRPFCL
jgi:hypothetical protein